MYSEAPRVVEQHEPSHALNISQTNFSNSLWLFFNQSLSLYAFSLLISPLELYYASTSISRRQEAHYLATPYSFHASERDMPSTWHTKVTRIHGSCSLSPWVGLHNHEHSPTVTKTEARRSRPELHSWTTEVLAISLS